MPETLDAERAELEAVTKALAKSPRLSRLALYLGEVYLSGKSDEINEYNIATEVFGRSKTSFDAGKDAIARVEAHRLRKGLKEFYDTKGKNHAIQMSIPVGTYIPLFTHRIAEVPSPAPVEPLDTSPAPSPPPSLERADLPPVSQPVPFVERRRLQERRRLHRDTSRPWLYPLLAVVLVLAAFCLTWAFRSASAGKDIKAGSSPDQAPSAPQPVMPNPLLKPVRLIAGYFGKPLTDSAGAVWNADQYFHGGRISLRPAGPIARTTDPALYGQWRTGHFSYAIPLQPGVYELHLYFVESKPENIDLNAFTVAINGDRALPAFDVDTDALGENFADERVFRDVYPSKDGLLHISFVGDTGVPHINAIELLPGIPHTQLPIRILTQPTPFTDHNGNIWRPDTYFLNGNVSVQKGHIEGTSDPALYSAERYGHFSYAIPVDSRSQYTVVLHFAELYFGPTASGIGGTGNRVFRVLCNGSTLLDNFDIFKEVGSLHALTKTFYHMKPTAQGKLDLTFEPIYNYATVSGIEVFDESK
ncbi:MAG: malectin domain-containing carbohydrate-binding protein [Terracidiphilus sp.]